MIYHCRLITIPTHLSVTRAFAIHHIKIRVSGFEWLLNWWIIFCSSIIKIHLMVIEMDITEKKIKLSIENTSRLVFSFINSKAHWNFLYIYVCLQYSVKFKEVERIFPLLLLLCLFDINSTWWLNFFFRNLYDNFLISYKFNVNKIFKSSLT